MKNTLNDKSVLNNEKPYCYYSNYYEYKRIEEERERSEKTITYRNLEAD